MDWLTHNYLTRGFWGDEAWTALISSLPVPNIIRVTGQDFHPPFYYLLTHVFIQVFGASEWIRLISVLFFLLIPIPVFWLMRKTAGKSPAWTAVFLVLASPILLTYAFEARAYALLAFLSTMTTLAFWKSMATRQKKWLFIYSITVVIGVYTHYYLWFVLAAHGLAWLLLYRKRFWRYLVVFVSVIAAQLPWIPTLLSQVSAVKQSYWIGPIDQHTHWEWFMRVAGGDTDQPQRMFVVWLLLFLLIVSPLFIYGRYKRFPKAYVYLWIWLVVPVVIPSVISVVFRPIFFYRYLIFCSIPIVMIVVWGLASVRTSVACGGGAFLLAFYLSISALNFAQFPYSMREEIDKVFADPRKKELLVTVLPSFAEVMYYDHGRLSVQVLSEGIVQFSGKALLDELVQLGRVTIAAPDPKISYWFIQPGPYSDYHAAQTQ